MLSDQEDVQGIGADSDVAAACTKVHNVSGIPVSEHGRRDFKRANTSHNSIAHDLHRRQSRLHEIWILLIHRQIRPHSSPTSTCSGATPDGRAHPDPGDPKFRVQITCAREEKLARTTFCQADLYAGLEGLCSTLFPLEARRQNFHGAGGCLTA